LCKAAHLPLGKANEGIAGIDGKLGWVITGQSEQHSPVPFKRRDSLGLAVWTEDGNSASIAIEIRAEDKRPIEVSPVIIVDLHDINPRAHSKDMLGVIVGRAFVQLHTGTDVPAQELILISSSVERVEDQDGRPRGDRVSANSLAPE